MADEGQLIGDGVSLASVQTYNREILVACTAAPAFASGNLPTSDALMGPLPALHALMTPPDRFTNSTFAAYRPETQRQHEALTEAKRFVEYIRAEHTLPGTKRLGRWIRRGERRWKGLYLVGPVGTGKTHLLASMYHALHPEVPCAFLHSGELFRAQTPP